MEEKIKRLPILSSDLYLFCLVLLVGALGFGMGRLSLQGDESTDIIRLTSESLGILEASTSTKLKVSSVAGTVLEPVVPHPRVQAGAMGMFVGSRTGKKYHLPTCPGALRIHDNNKIWFQSREDAVSKGYTPAGNCKGL